MITTPEPSTPDTPAVTGARVAGWRGAYRRLPVAVLAGAWVLVPALAAAAATSIDGVPALQAALGAVALLGLIHAIAYAQPIVATLVVLTLTFPFTPAIAGIYLAGTYPTPDPVGTLITMMASFALLGLFAHRTSTTRPWVTVLLGVLATVLVSPFLLAWWPQLGVIASWPAMVAVLWVRSRGVAAWRRRRAIRSQLRNVPGLGTTPRRSPTELILADLASGYAQGGQVRIHPDLPAVDHIVASRRTIALVAVLPQADTYEAATGGIADLAVTANMARTLVSPRHDVVAVAVLGEGLIPDPMPVLTQTPDGTIRTVHAIDAAQLRSHLATLLGRAPRRARRRDLGGLDSLDT